MSRSRLARMALLADASSLSVAAGLRAAERPLTAPAPLVIDPLYGNAAE